MTGLEWCAVIIVIQLGCIIVIQLLWAYIQFKELSHAHFTTEVYQREARDSSRVSLQQMDKAVEYLRYFREKA